MTTENVAETVKLFRHALISLATCIAAMLGFWLVEGRDYVTRDQVAQIVTAKAPTIDSHYQSQKMLTEAITENTTAIVELRVNLNHLLQVKPSDVYEKVESLEAYIKRQDAHQR
jgi:hypothetical protein